MIAPSKMCTSSKLDLVAKFGRNELWMQLGSPKFKKWSGKLTWCVGRTLRVADQVKFMEDF